jgi:hypothetical protein
MVTFEGALDQPLCYLRQGVKVAGEHIGTTYFVCSFVLCDLISCKFKKCYTSGPLYSFGLTFSAHIGYLPLTL